MSLYQIDMREINANLADLCDKPLCEVEQDMRFWIEDAFEDAPEDLTTLEVFEGVQRHYDGGLAAFLSDAGA